MQSPNFSSVRSLLLSVEYCTLYFVMFAIFHDVDDINYVITGLRLRLHTGIKNRKKLRNLNTPILIFSQNRKI